MDSSPVGVDTRTPPATALAAGGAPVLYGLTAFLSAGLLFLAEPMVAKMVLPRFGGAPAVWNTSMVFFQAVLLLGYLYVHASAVYMTARRQTMVHVGLLAGTLLVTLPLALPAAGNPDLIRHPVTSLAWILLAGVGVPFFALSASAPLLQRWFASLRHPSARDPYFLYAASSAGSLAGLLSYPILVEPLLTLSQQARLWTVGYFALIALFGACAFVVWAHGRRAESSPAHPDATDRPGPARRLRWLLLAFVPSSLALGVTTHVTTDVAAVPLLWVVPLALYLVTFVLAFARRRLVSLHWVGKALPWLLGVLLLNVFTGVPRQVWVSAPLNFLGLFAIGLLCHGQVADDRPNARYLTEFYFWLSLGGVAGGIFNAIVAPAVFSSVFEYPLVLGAAAFFQAAAIGRRKSTFVLAAFPLATALLIFGLTAIVSALGQPVLPRLTLAFTCIMAVVWFGHSRKPWLFGAAAVSAVLSSGAILPPRYTVLAADRSFFGVYRILEKDEGRFHGLLHGTTLHGQEDRRSTTCEPLSYYSRTGPVGDVFSGLGTRGLSPSRVAVIGLGTGSLACYSQAGQAWTFYEIDPLVERIARTSGYFTFLSRAAGAVEVVLGDGRLSLQADRSALYDVIVLDAFSSDAIPVHLLTAEATAVYFSHLKPEGLLLFNISNRHLDLRRVVASLAKNAAGVAFDRTDISVEPNDLSAGKTPSEWAVVGRSPGAIDMFGSIRDWKPLVARNGERCWTDEFSNILTVLR